MHSRFAPSCSLAFALIVAALPAFALDELDFSSARDKSMGGIHVALADDSSVLLSNPAGLADLPASYSVADLGLQAIGPVFDIANLIVKGDTSPTAIFGFLKDNDFKLYTGAEITGPLATGFTGNGLGFGLFNKTSCIIDAASIDSISITATEDILLTGGYAVRFDLGGGHELAAGIAAKGYVIGSVAPTMGIVEAENVFSNPMSLLSNSAFDLTTGIGADLGLRWAWQNTLAAGLAYRDLYSPAIVTTYSSIQGFLGNSASAKTGDPTSETLPSKLDAGFSWTPELGGLLSKVMDSFVLCLDYKDILDLFSVVPRNPILNVGLGLETRVLDIIRIRAGIADALLSAGMGIDLGACTVNLAVFGTELGLDPGDRTCYNLLLDFSFKIH
jgi:hypothetical protein